MDDAEDITIRSLSRLLVSTEDQLSEEQVAHEVTKAKLDKLSSDVGTIYRRWGQALGCAPDYAAIDSAIKALLAS